MAEPQKFHTWKLSPKKAIVDGAKNVSIGKVRSTVSTHLMTSWTLNPVVAGGMVGCAPLRTMREPWSSLVLGNESPISWIWIAHNDGTLGRVLRYLTPIRPVSEPNMFHTPQRIFQLKRKVSL